MICNGMYKRDELIELFRKKDTISPKERFERLDIKQKNSVFKIIKNGMVKSGNTFIKMGVSLIMKILSLILSMG